MHATSLPPVPLLLARRAWRWFAALCLAACGLAAHAQTIDDVQVVTQGSDLVLRVSFNATVRFLQQTPTASASLYQVGWTLVAADEAILNQGTEESKRIAAQGTLPEVTLTYPVAKGSRTRQLIVQAGAPVAMTARQGPSSRSIDLVFPGQAASTPTPAPAPAVEPAAAAPAQAAASAVVAAPEIEAQATALLEQARTALAAKRNEDAVGTLNQLLRLPPNSASQQAQELVGVAWERLGDTGRARTEYELYLRLYPQDEGADRVRQRLAAMTGETVVAAPAPGPATSAPARAATRSRYNGSVAQYYYGGKARTQSLVNLPGGIDQSTLSQTTESAVVTSVDMGARYEAADSDTRAVVRGTNSINLSSASHAQSLLSAAYLDYKRNESGLAMRVGRQSAIGGGLLGLFDGASLTYPLNQTWKLDVMGGAPSNPLVSAPQERLAAGMVEADGLLDHWGGDAYVIDQTTQGITNRRGIGLEVRFSDDTFSTYTLIDYDLLFHKLNAFSLQGSAQVPGQTTLTLLVDTRNAPSLEMTNALISTGATSLKELLLTQTRAQIRADALSTTARARQALLSVSRPLSQSWQLALDMRYSAVGATPAVGDFEAMPATGAQYGATVQLTGTNLYSKHDIDNFNFSLLRAPTFTGTQVSVGNLTAFRDNDITLEPTLTYYAQHDDQGVHLHRAGMGLRGTYRFSKRASVLSEGVYEHTHTTAPLSHDTTSSVFFYVGYRYDLF